MAPSSPTCVSCDRPFPGNGELASLPEGRRIAFDPGQRRVWRICTKCGEWNLLGAEAAGAALGELEARVPNRGSALLITHVGPRLELLRVDNFADVRVGELAMAERRDGLTKESRKLGRIAAGLFFVLLPLLIWHAFTRPGPYVQFPAFVGAGMLGREWYRRRQGLPLSTGRLVIGTIGVALGCLAVVLGRLIPDELVVAVLAGLSTTPVTNLFAAKTHLPSGRRVRAPDTHWDAIGIRWSPAAGGLSLQVRNGPWLDAADSRAYLRLITDGAVVPVMSDEDLAKAHLLATTHDVAGILGALDAWRQDRDDTLRLADIPVMYLVALDLAFARQDSGSLKAQLAHEKLLEAARVADEAELLDKGTA